MAWIVFFLVSSMSIMSQQNAKLFNSMFSPAKLRHEWVNNVRKVNDLLIVIGRLPRFYHFIYISYKRRNAHEIWERNKQKNIIVTCKCTLLPWFLINFFNAHFTHMLTPFFHEIERKHLWNEIKMIFFRPIPLMHTKYTHTHTKIKQNMLLLIANIISDCFFFTITQFWQMIIKYAKLIVFLKFTYRSLFTLIVFRESYYTIHGNDIEHENEMFKCLHSKHMPFMIFFLSPFFIYFVLWHI